MPKPKPESEHEPEPEEEFYDDDELNPEMGGTTDFDPVELEAMLEEMFKEADQDGNGTLDMAEFAKLMATTNLGLSKAELDMLLAEADENTDGNVSYAEFVPLAGQLSTDPSAASQAARLEPYPSQRPPSVCVPHSPVHDTSHSPPVATPASEPPGVEAWAALNAQDTAAFLAREHGRVVHLLLGASAGLRAARTPRGASPATSLDEVESWPSSAGTPVSGGLEFAPYAAEDMEGES